MQVINAAAEFQGQFAALRSATRQLVVHHAAANYPQAYGIDDARAIARFHVQSRGWAGIGYHEVLAESTPGGPIACYLVSNPLSVRAHVWGRNHEAWGITMAADMTKGVPPQKWVDALALRLVEAKRRWPSAQIVGHKEIALPGHGTTCPGERWALWKPGLLRQVEVMLGQAPPLISRRYRARYRCAIYERSEGTGPVWGVLEQGETLAIDATYPAMTAHDSLGRGFIRLEDLETLP